MSLTKQQLAKATLPCSSLVCLHYQAHLSALHHIIFTEAICMYLVADISIYTSTQYYLGIDAVVTCAAQVSTLFFSLTPDDSTIPGSGVL
jgi:hypothetical protein